MASTAARRTGVFLLVLAGLWALWEGFKWFGERTELTIGTFMVNDVTFPHLHDIVGQLFEPSRRNGPLLIEVLWDAALFTAKEAVAGFLLGAAIGLLIGIVLHHSRMLQRGFLPYIVASQTVPILAIAPMVVVYLGGELQAPAWVSVSVIAAYLTFFPVTVQVLRGLRSVDPRALDLMQSYAATTWETYRKLRMPASLPYLFNALKIASTGSLIGAIVSELMGANSGLGVLILQLQYTTAGASDRLWALVIEVAAIGVGFFLVISLLERVLVPWQPEFRRTPQGES